MFINNSNIYDNVKKAIEQSSSCCFDNWTSSYGNLNPHHFAYCSEIEGIFHRVVVKDKRSKILLSKNFSNEAEFQKFAKKCVFRKPLRTFSSLFVVNRISRPQDLFIPLSCKGRNEPLLVRSIAFTLDLATLIFRIITLIPRILHLKTIPEHPLKKEFNIQDDHVTVHFFSQQMIKEYGHLFTIAISQRIYFDGNPLDPLGSLYISEQNTQIFERNYYTPFHDQAPKAKIPKNLEYPKTRDIIIQRVDTGMKPTRSEALDFMKLNEKHTDKQRKASYRKLALQYHPDKCTHDPQLSDAGFKWLTWCVEAI